MTVYAVGEEMYGETDAEKKIETTYGTAATKDLSDYMTYAAGTDASEKFTYVITGGNSTTATANGNHRKRVDKRRHAFDTGRHECRYVYAHNTGNGKGA